MHVTWTALELEAPARACPWAPDGSTYAQAGHGAAGTAEFPSFDGTWWSVLATWPDAGQAAAAAPVGAWSTPSCARHGRLPMALPAA